jgi:hypothetical protein
MIPPFSGPALGNIMQIAWVTPDLEKSLALFKTLYKVPDFLVMENRFPADVFGERGEMHLRIALANVDNIQLELIEPMGGGIDRIYRDALPGDGSHANVLHHICIKVDGTEHDWDSYVSGLGPDRPVAYIGYIPGVRFIYTDERATLGVYVEHVWFSPEIEAQMASAIPTYRTR